MAIPETEAMAKMVHANDKLLKALMTLLALKDEHLMDELRTVFTAAVQNGSQIGQADAPTWAHIRQELAMINTLVDQVERAEDAGMQPRIGVN